MNATCWKMKNMWQYQRRKPKERVYVCWESLVRRHIKAIQLIDEAFYNWRVKSSCHSLFFFLNCCLFLFHLPPLSYHTPPVVVSSHSSHLTFELEGCCGHGITKSPSALLRTAESVLQQAMVVPATVRPSNETKMHPIPVRLGCWFISVSWTYKQSMETQSQATGAWPPEDFRTGVG